MISIPRKEHIGWVDLLRVLACFLVVFAHCCDPFVGQFDADCGAFLTGAFAGSLVRCSVPLFVMMTGVLLLPVGAALRLAKFNIDDTQRSEFCGLPTPAAGLFCASLGLLHAEGMLALPYEAVLFVAAVTAWLMISPIRMFALKFHGFGWAGNQLRYLFLGACVVLILFLGAYAIPAIFVLYVVVSLVRWLLQGRKTAEA